MSIRVNKLTKYFGEQKALDEISFSASEGEIVGFLGPNGAGKSTTMKIATGYLPPDSGTVEVCGIDVAQRPLDVKKKVGYLPEHNPLYLDMYVREYLAFIGKLHSVKGGVLKSRINEVVEMCGLTREQNKLIGALSKGYRQRVGLAQALIHDPEVLVLDEPTTGLDPNQIIEIRNLIKNTSADKTVIFSSHIMQEVQALCDRVVVIDRGRIVADDKIEQLKSEKVEVVSLVLEFSEAPNFNELTAIEGVLSVEAISDLKYRVKATTTKDVRPLLFDFASEKSLKLLGLQQEEVTMENVFRELTNSKS
ncbi:MAG: gliding motility-associated ABC transporter ATP-binding subunit GldA [Fulvivirga sp.]|uniref:gliding motility-associated ABC transporter ATP-binding subunit GldA n=1 Tax=Fulvivirga sp. TaxID=1931237 RepID=UPI0032EACEF8